jgi:predicted ArsR family transcriptional regulator
MVNENPTREKIIMLLKKNGPLSIDDLSKELNITSMGIRQHLLSLERKGIIDYVTKRQGIGRPAFLYKLTDRADDLFPKAYHEFIIQVFKDIEKNKSREMIDNIFKWRKNRILKEMRDALSEKKTLDEKVDSFKDILESKGYLVEMDNSNNHYTLKQFNCPIYRLAYEYTDACRYELQMYRELFGKEVSREECLAEAGTSCTYFIPKTSLKH